MKEATKYALVTGSTKGIGKQIAIDLLKKGYFVLLNYSKDESVIHLLKQELSEISDNYEIIKCDLSEITSIDFFVKQIKEVTDYLDVVVLNTAVTNRNDFYELTPVEWNQVVNTNLSVPFFLLQGVGRMIRENGNIIFIGALMGTVPHALSIPYGVSKAGVHMLSKYLVKVFNDKKITVNTIAPGFVETPWQKNKPKEIRENIEKKVALHRFATVEEVSSTCLPMIENRYINGQVLVLDGGYSYQ